MPYVPKGSHMGKRRAIAIGSRTFSGVGDAKQFVRDIVVRYPDGAMASDMDAEFLSDLLELHPRCTEKVGAGIRGFKFDTNPEYTNTRTIFILRTDGSETDFSWIKCIDGETSKRLTKAALRNAVMDQIIAFKQQAFVKMPVLCPETGEELTWQYSHVDHHAPKTFEVLIDEWLDSEGLSLDEIPISASRDRSFFRELTDERQRQSWHSFHDRHKQLRLLSPFANLSVAKRKPPL